MPVTHEMLEVEIVYQKEVRQIWEDAITKLHELFDDNEDIPEHIRVEMESIVRDAMKLRIAEFAKLKNTMRQYGF